MRDDGGTGPVTHGSGRMGAKDPVGIPGATTQLRVDFAARLRNRSTWPPVSTIRWVPVKNGWQTEQISVLSSLRVEPVVNVFPHTQVTTASS